MRGYSDTDLHSVGAAAENIFNRIGTDTGLYSYLAGQTYTVVLYKDPGGVLHQNQTDQSACG